jgi:threonine dehydratase
MRERLAGRLVRTPLVESATLSRRLGRPVYLKLENLQHTGSFKSRPALASVLALAPELRARGIVTSSSGNFASGAAWAAREEGVPATVVVMPSAEPFKVEKARRYGAQIVVCEDDYADRQRRVDALVAETGAGEIHPHSSAPTLAGDATVGDEILEDMPDCAAILIPVSGGGLFGGVMESLEVHGHGAAVYGAQPEGNRIFADSLRAGERLTGPPAQTLADGLTATRPGPQGFAVAQRRAAGIAVVPEAEIGPAMRLLAEEEGLVIEPSCAVAVAAALQGTGREDTGPLVIVITGGNIDPERHRRLCSGDAPARP